MRKSSTRGLDPITIVVASNNAHKVDEIVRALHIEGVRFVAVSEVIPDWVSPLEDGETFEENARIKAEAVHRATGLPALADDSGLMVDALGGAPGVSSSCYGGVEGDDARNNARLLETMVGIADEDRTARFVTTLVLVGLERVLDSAPGTLIASGHVEGLIGHTPRGEYGFGYDPLFIVDVSTQTTMAQLSLEEKNALSHRGSALRNLKPQLERALAPY